MMFDKKLSLLMNITSTTNSSLAKNISLDPSYISRLKNGKRKPSKNGNYLKQMSYYLAKQCKSDSQKTIIYNTLNLPTSSYKYTLDKLSSYIYNWLIDDPNQHKEVKEIIGTISDFQFKKETTSFPTKYSTLADISVANGEVFYGIDGKRQAVIAFLTGVLKDKNNRPLLLYSDESIDWLIENKQFTQQWATLLSKILAMGNKVIIIHTVNRNINEMLAAIKEWLPMYMTGKIEPYHYPKARDRVFKRTLFICPEKIALVSSSVDKSMGTNSNFIYTDPQIINSFSVEFYEYLNKCRPLMQIFDKEKSKDYLSLLNEFESESGDSVLQTDGLSVISIPLNIIKEILIDSDEKEIEGLYLYHKKRIELFKDNLKSNSFTEIISLPDIKDIAKGRIKVNFSNMLIDSGIYYSKTQITSHIENIIFLLESYANYNLYIDYENWHPVYSLYVKDEIGVVIGKEISPTIIFALNERDMTFAFWDYMGSITSRYKKQHFNKKETLKILKDLIATIEGLPR